MIYNKYTEDSEREWLKERSQNIFWTILGDYEQKMPSLYVEDMEKARHLSIIWGATYYYFDIKMIQGFVRYIAAKPDFYAVFFQVLWHTLEEYCYLHLSKVRPAVTFLFHQYYEDYLAKNQDRNSKDSAEIIEKAYYMEKQGFLRKENRWLKSILADIHELATQIDTTETLIEGVEEIYRRYFVTENWIQQVAGKEEVTNPQKTKAEYKPDESFLSSKKGIAPVEVYVEKIVDAEFNPNSYRGKASKEYLEAEREKSAKLSGTVNKKKQTDFEKVWLFFGDLILPLQEIEQMEKRVSTGTHEHKKLYITDGSFSGESSDYQLRFMEEQRNFNLEYFEVHYRACRRHIESLRSLLVNALLPDSLEESHPADYGKLNAGQAWRAELFHNHKIFERIIKNEIGNFAVEILLDGSGSQSERQAQVAMQGYIIAEALSQCHIPCRISAYATFLDYTILRVYKDFEQPAEKNMRIFDFFGTGMNRDGLAFRAVSDLFKKRKEENKILIILSDGKPNDVRVFKKNAENPELEEYKGERAVKDTAMEVRKMRMQGISVLGVFNGEEEDLPAQQTIFGKDFAYIKKLNQFSKIVGAYLKKELRKFM